MSHNLGQPYFEYNTPFSLKWCSTAAVWSKLRWEQPHTLRKPAWPRMPRNTVISLQTQPFGMVSSMLWAILSPFVMELTSIKRTQHEQIRSSYHSSECATILWTTQPKRSKSEWPSTSRNDGKIVTNHSFFSYWYWTPSKDSLPLAKRLLWTTSSVTCFWFKYTNF